MSAEYSIDALDLDSKPFTIRGHHLGNFRALLWRRYKVNNLSDEEVANKCAHDLVAAIRTESRKKEIRARHGMGRIEVHNGLTYEQDVMGFNDQDEEIYKLNVGAVALRFLKSADDTMVKIEINKADNLCSICIVGGHCSNNTTNNDTRYINLILGDFDSNSLISLGELKAKIFETFGAF